MHPILRMAVSTVIIGDKGLLVTDARRHSTDYTAMGLPVNGSSKHYPQADGYVYAVDIRTLDRSDTRNDVLQTIFELFGLQDAAPRGHSRSFAYRIA